MPIPISTILHLSDLHLGKDFTDAGTADKATVKSVLKNKRLVMQGHDKFVLASLSSEIRIAARKVGAEHFDFHVVTGDISTSANSKERFEFARRFLTGTVTVDATFDAGLSLDKNTLFCIPGNHDKLEELTLERYSAQFNDLPAIPNYVSARTSGSGQRFIFYGIDSNWYIDGNIGLGKISPETLEWFAKAIKENAPSGTDKANTIQVVLLHHHPCDLSKFRRQSLKGIMYARFTTLEEGGSLLDACRGKIDVIMHGHEHFPIAFRDERSNCVVISCGTTSEFQLNKSHSNCFHILVFQGRNLEVLQFSSGTGHFSQSSKWKFNLDSTPMDRLVF